MLEPVGDICVFQRTWLAVSSSRAILLEICQSGAAIAAGAQFLERDTGREISANIRDYSIPGKDDNYCLVFMGAPREDA